jgi:mannose-6-phosphate isomerase-like protein (cupin superfamily)
MTDTKSYPYATHLDIKFPSLDLIDVQALAKSVTDQWYNQTLCRVNDSVVRLGVIQGEYHWHKHDNDDEFFFVLSGRFIVDLEERSVELLPGQGLVVPKAVMHCTRAPERSVVLMVETAEIVPTGDTQKFRAYTARARLLPPSWNKSQIVEFPYRPATVRAGSSRPTRQVVADK